MILYYISLKLPKLYYTPWLAADEGRVSTLDNENLIYCIFIYFVYLY